VNAFSANNLKFIPKYRYLMELFRISPYYPIVNYKIFDQTNPT